MPNKTFVKTLFPPADSLIPLQGLYLKQNICKLGVAQQPFIYANYVSSVDGRIAVTGPSGERETPEHLTTPQDWLLFKELQAQADCLLTHSGYLRSLANGKHGNVLQIPDGEANHYLHAWREQQGLPQQPHIVVLCRTINFVLPDFLLTGTQAVTVITTTTANSDAVASLRNTGIRVVEANDRGFVDAQDVYQVLQAINVRSVYLQTGPDLLHSMLSNHLLNRLYLTMNLSLVGGADFLTMLGSGPALPGGHALRLRSLYMIQSTEDAMPGYGYEKSGYIGFRETGSIHDQAEGSEDKNLVTNIQHDQLFASFDV